MKSTLIVANRLASQLRAGKFIEAYNELFDEQAESIDPLYSNEPPLNGIDKLIQREKGFLSKVQIKKIAVSAPIIAGEYFTISLKMIFDMSGLERTIEELCLYKMKNGKILSQQFFIANQA
jgi:hypothetical protein